MDRIDRFRVFVRVADCASFTRAADTLGLPRSTVSAAVRSLEERVGVRLLNRTTRKVVLTDEGRALHERCRQVLAEVEETEALFHPSAEGPSGRVRINVPGRMGRLIIAPALPAFLSAWPGIDVELGVTDRAVNLIEEGVDCVLRVGPLSESGLVARRISDLDLINVASPAYLAAWGEPRTPADLDRHQVVNYASPSNGRVEDWEWVEGGVVHSRPAPGRVTANNAEACIACCLAGLGLLQVPAYDVADALRRGELVEVMSGWRAEPMPMHLVFPHRQPMSGRVRVFADWLETLLKDATRRG